MATGINRDKVNSFIPEKVAAKAINVATSYMNLARTVYRDYEDEVAREGQTVTVPQFGSMSANEMSKTGTVTVQAPEDSEVTVTLDQHWESTFLIRDVARAMAKENVLEGYVKAGSIALAEKVENTLAALYSSAGSTVSGGASPSKSHLKTARKTLVDNNVPRLAPKHVYLDSDYYNELLGDSTLIDASASGSTSPLIEGKINKLYGFGLFESQNVQTSGSPSTYHSLAYVEDSIALAMRPLSVLPEPMGSDLGARQATVVDQESGVGMRVTYSWDKDALGIQVTLDLLFGVAVRRSDWLIDIQHT